MLFVIFLLFVVGLSLILSAPPALTLTKLLGCIFSGVGAFLCIILGLEVTETFDDSLRQATILDHLTETDADTMLSRLALGVHEASREQWALQEAIIGAKANEEPALREKERKAGEGFQQLHQDFFAVRDAQKGEGFKVVEGSYKEYVPGLASLPTNKVA